MNAVTNIGKRTGQRVIRQARSAFITATVLLSLFCAAAPPKANTIWN